MKSIMMKILQTILDKKREEINNNSNFPIKIYYEYQFPKYQKELIGSIYYLEVSQFLYSCNFWEKCMEITISSYFALKA